jgi:hypothetical protein
MRLLCSGNDDAGGLEEMDAKDTRAAAEAMACISSSSIITITITVTIVMLAVSSSCHHHRGFRAGPVAVAFCARYDAWAMR